MFKLLTGHTNFDNAFVVADYPYGRQLRTTKRMWVETAVKGSQKGEQRGVCRTYDPKRSSPEYKAWNKPREGNYFDRVYLFTDTRSGYTHFYPLHIIGGWYQNWCNFVACGLASQLCGHTNEQEELNRLIHLDRKMCPRSWGDLDNVWNALAFPRGEDGENSAQADNALASVSQVELDVIRNAYLATTRGEFTLPPTRGLGE